MRGSFCGDPLGDLLGQEAPLSFATDPVAVVGGGCGLPQEGRKTRCEWLVGRPDLRHRAGREKWLDAGRKYRGRFRQLLEFLER
jgi:hypothetical protein